MNLLRTLRQYAAPIPCWAPIGLRGEQQFIDVRLRDAREAIDLTGRNVIASLVPLTIAVGREAVTGGELAFVDRASGRELAALRLRRPPTSAGQLPKDISLLEVDGGRHRCLPSGTRTWQRLMQANWRHEAGFRMTNRAIHLLAMFYICPRPVVLVSVDDGTRNNLFPMDLIGRLGDRFTLALRHTSPSVETLRTSKRVALADAPLHLLKTVYKLGKHHRLDRIDWDALPFDSVRSPQFGLRVPAAAQRIREFSIEDSRVVGSHVFFVCRQESELARGEEPRLHHTCGIHKVWRQRHGALPWQEPGDPT